MPRAGTDPTQARFVALRGAVYTGDGAAALRALTLDIAAETPQYAGDGALLALRQVGRAAVQIATSIVSVIRARDADGDAELAHELEASLGGRPGSGLAPLAVDLDELSSQLEGDPAYAGGAIDLRTGEVHPESYFEDRALWEDSPAEGEEAQDEEADDEDRWLHIVALGSGPAYDDMVAFRDSIEDPRLGELLDVALAGRGAFRRFKDVLAVVPGELDRWHRCADDRARGRARAWLAEEGYRAAIPDRPTRD